MLPPGRTKKSPTLVGDSNPLASAITQRDRTTLDMVRSALDNRQAMLAFQPVVFSSHPGKVAFYEGLIRIRDGTGRIIPAKEFIPSVEKTEIGRRIDCLALELGLRELEAEPGIRLSINLSALSIGYPPWIKALEAGLARDETIGERLILEITESSAITVPELVMKFMDQLQTRGVAFALDDFGAGYTSFRYLRDFFFDILKIDGHFVRGIHADRDNQILLSALTDIGKHFEMITVAESVEHPEEAEFLRGLGIDCLQGFHFGTPLINPSWRMGGKNQQAG